MRLGNSCTLFIGFRFIVDWRVPQERWQTERAQVGERLACGVLVELVHQVHQLDRTRSDGEVAKRSADSNDDLVQEVLADAAAWPLLEEDFVDSGEFFTKQDAVVAQAAARSRNDQARRTKVAGREDRHNQDVIAGSIANVGRDDEHEAGLMRIRGLAGRKG